MSPSLKSLLCGMFAYMICLYVLVAILFFHKTAKMEADQKPRETTTNTSILYLQPPQPPPPKIKMILYWNSDFRFGIGHQPFIDNQCRVSNCETTNDKSLIGQADAVMIHGPIVEPAVPPLSLPHQKFVYFQDEPHMALSRQHLDAIRGLIKLTLTYRRDSDIRFVHSDWNRNQTIARDICIDPKSRPKMAVWVVSNCETPSKRERYVEELRRYITVDIYGGCGNLKCLKSHNDHCGEVFGSNYMFYLSLENSYCKDYVSEKLYYALKYDMVPIVLGGADYATETPPDSVINVKDFSSPRHLAHYLIYLRSNATAYNQYFEWKKLGYSIEINPNRLMAKPMCRLCEILNDPDYVYRDYTDFRSWWMSGMCTRGFVKRRISPKNSGV